MSKLIFDDRAETRQEKQARILTILAESLDAFSKTLKNGEEFIIEVRPVDVKFRRLEAPIKSDTMVVESNDWTTTTT